MSTLHITNGDSVRNTLRTIVDDPIAIVADPLHEGPAPDGVEGRAWCELRARFLAGDSFAGYTDVLHWLMEWDAGIERAAEYEEVVLWFEHDLFDQLGLIRVLDRFVRLNVASGESPTRVLLICIGEFPGIDRFVGLGQLTAKQLSPLLDRRQPVTSRQFSIARDLWAAFRRPDPQDLVRLTAGLTGDSPFPFLGAALTRFLQEYPSTVNGLSRSADAILKALTEGPLHFHKLFVLTQATEQAPFMGDLTLYGIAQRLASQRVPLVAIETRGGEDPDDALHNAWISITDAGREVAAGRQDAVRLNGIDEWRGGVRLRGTDRSPWRWDPSAETLVS